MPFPGVACCATARCCASRGCAPVWLVSPTDPCFHLPRVLATAFLQANAAWTNDGQRSDIVWDAVHCSTWVRLAWRFSGAVARLDIRVLETTSLSPPIRVWSPDVYAQQGGDPGAPCQTVCVALRSACDAFVTRLRVLVGAGALSGWTWISKTT